MPARRYDNPACADVRSQLEIARNASRDKSDGRGSLRKDVDGGDQGACPKTTLCLYI